MTTTTAAAASDHILIVTGLEPDPDNPGHYYTDDLEAEVECLDAERTHCRLWFECSTCLDPHFPTARKREGETVIHGVAHRVIDGMLMTPTDRCLIDSDDFGAIQDAACEAGNGRWYVDVEWNDGLDVIVGKTPTPAPENAGA